MDAAGVENLSGSIGSGLGCLARAVVVGFCGKVYTAVDGSVREHGARLIPLSSGEIWVRVWRDYMKGFLLKNAHLTCSSALLTKENEKKAKMLQYLWYILPSVAHFNKYIC